MPAASRPSSVVVLPPFLALGGALVLLLHLGGCITVNINFPAEAVEEAAEEIVGDARSEDGDLEESGTTGSSDESLEGGESGEGGGAGDAAGATGKEDAGADRSGAGGSDGDGPGGDSGPSRGADATPVGLAAPAAAVVSPEAVVAAALLGAVRPSAVAGKIEVGVDDPVVKKIRESIKKRFKKKLAHYYKKGAVGEKRDGYLALRPGAKLTARERREVKALVAAENRDRKNLYNRIVEINDDIEPEDLPAVQAIFARVWIDKCKKGWWIQDETGKWVRKKTGPKKKPGKKPKK